MDSPHGPSLLDYARHHGIASDCTAINPSFFVDLPQDTTETHPSQLSQYYDAPDDLDQALRKDKLNIRKDAVRLLSSVLRETRFDRTDTDWAKFLPPFKGADGLKVELPLFPIGAPIELPSSPLRYYDEKHDTELVESVANQPSTVNVLTQSLDHRQRAMEQVKQERLNCSKSAFLLLQDVTRRNPVRLDESPMTRERPPLLLSPANNLGNEMCDDKVYRYSRAPNQDDLSRIACATLAQMGVGPNSTSDDSSAIMSIYSPPSTAEPTVTTSPLETKPIPRSPKRRAEKDQGDSPKKRAEKRPAPFSATLGSLSTFLESRGIASSRSNI